MRRHIKELSIQDLENILKGWAEPKFHARQIFTWIYQKGALDFDSMSDIPQGLRRKLKENFYITSTKLIKALKSKDGTEKFLLQLWDKNLIECVSIPTEKRITGCISSQVGCKFACGFCASGLSGFKRNLTTAEMLEEVLYLGPTHIVFMGIGEPLDNYDNVLEAIRIINSRYAFNIAARRITISTCGIVPAIKKLANEGLQIELSISLHAADDKTRSQIMPMNKKYSLKKLISACKEYIKKTNRQITFEYVLIQGINSDLQNAKNLSTILKGLKLAKVNLITANKIEGLTIEPPQNKDILLFRDYLLRQGINVTLRKPRGEDIDAACGQLRLKYVKE